MAAHELIKPPALAGKLLGSVLSGDELVEKSGDMDEVFFAMQREKGVFRATLWYWLQVVRAVPVFAVVQIIWSMSMWRNYLKSVWRNIRRNKTYTVLNLMGLALGMSCAMALFMIVHEEMSYDNYHRDVDRIYRISEAIDHGSGERHYAPIAWPMGPAVEENCPQVEAVVRVYGFGSHLIENGDQVFYESQFFFAGKDFFRVLTFDFLAGNPDKALEQPMTVVLSRRMALKYFGETDVLGKTLLRNGQEYKITGIMKDPPGNTHLKTHFIASLKSIENQRWFSNWRGTEAYTYVKLRPGTDADAFAGLILRLGDRYMGGDWASGEHLHEFRLQPLRDIHLHSALRYEIEAPGNVNMVRMLMGIGALVLLVSCMNYINLSTARSMTRAREVGVRKVMGAWRWMLVRQFWADSLTLALTAMVTALAVLAAGLPMFNELAGTHFSVSHLLSLPVLAASLLTVLFCGVGAGLYPSVLMASYQPAGILRGMVTKGQKGAGVRRFMVVFQFVISIVLAVGTLVVLDQINHMKNHYPGFNKEQKLVIPARGTASFRENYRAFKAAMTEHAGVLAATASSSVPGRPVSNYTIQLVNRANARTQGMYHLYFDEDFLHMYEIPLLAGRDYQAGISTDISTFQSEGSGGFLVNEAAMKALGFASPEEMVGEQLRTGCSNHVGAVLGVVEDFHFKGMQTEVEPLIMEYFTPYFNCISLLVDTKSLRPVMTHVEKCWNEFFPDVPLEHFFLDSDFARLYEKEIQLGRMAGLFTLFGLLVACLGLVGLSAFTASQRRKEIGIRKSLGASSVRIMALLSGDYVRWIIMANILAWPLAWFIMNHWLTSFAVRTALHIQPFLLTGLATLAVGLLTVSLQSYRASAVNPVDTLRQE